MIRPHLSAVEAGSPEPEGEAPTPDAPSGSEADAGADAQDAAEDDATEADAAEDHDAPEAGPEAEPEPEPSKPPPAPSLVEVLRAELAAKEAQLHDYIAAYKQAKDEMAKARERLERDRDKQLRRDRMALAGKLLEVVDNLDRSLHGVAPDGPAATLAEGVRLVHRQFADVLKEFGVTRIAAMGEAFDPRLHEAVGAVPAHGAQKDQEVIYEQRAGYLFEGQLLRAAQVVVAQR